MRYYLKRKLNINMFDILIIYLTVISCRNCKFKDLKKFKVHIVILNQNARAEIIQVIRIINAIRHLMLIEFHNKSEKEAYKF